MKDEKSSVWTNVERGRGESLRIGNVIIQIDKVLRRKVVLRIDAPQTASILPGRLARAKAKTSQPLAQYATRGR